MTNASEKISFTKKNLIDAISLKKPAKIPVCVDMVGWAFHYAGVKLTDIIDDPQTVSDNFCKVFEENPIDVASTAAFGCAPVKAIKAMGLNTYEFAYDGISVVHNQAACKTDGVDVYDEVIKDAANFMYEIHPKRKVPALQGTKQEALAAIKTAYPHLKNLIDTQMLTTDYITNTLGIYGIFDEAEITYYPPFDTFFDSYRGIKNALIDIRRIPDKVQEACDAIWESQSFIREFDEESIKNPLPMMNTIYHSACFLNPKQFDRFIWKYFLDGYKKVLEAGKKFFLFGEGSFMQTLDRYNDLPKGSCLILLDRDDPFEAYKIFGETQAIMCGVRNDMLQLETAEKCKNYVKKCFDVFAPGGGFVFSPNQELVSPKDATIENFKAVFEQADILSRKY